MAPLCALLAVFLIALNHVLPFYSDVFMPKMVNFIKDYFLVFLLGAIFVLCTGLFCLQWRCRVAEQTGAFWAVGLTLIVGIISAFLYDYQRVIVQFKEDVNYRAGCSYGWWIHHTITIRTTQDTALSNHKRIIFF